MKTESTTRAAYSGSFALTLVSMIAAVMLALPTMAWSQTDVWTVYNTGNSELPYNGVTALAVDAQGTIWVGTGRWYAIEGGGLARFDGDNWIVYNTSNSGLPNNDHTGLSIDANGNIWSGTEGGLAKFDGVNWTVYKINNSGLPSDRVGAPSFDSKGNAWIGTFPSGGLVKFDGVNWTVYNTANSGLPNNFITRLTVDAQDNVWMGTYGSGLVKFDGTNWTVYTTANSGLPHNQTSFLSVDGQGSVWIGTYGGGLAKFNGTNWTVYNSANSGLPNNWIWNVTVDAQGNIWVATQAGLAMFDGANWTVFNITNSPLPDNEVYSIAVDAKWNVWVGTANGGLAVYRVGEQPPIVDFNGDGKVDIKDLLRLIESWSQNDPLLDIAPRPFGDGIVDVQDLEILMSYWQQEVNDPTLKACWKLDETEGDVAYDSAGANDAVVVGDALWQPEGGIVNGALELDGVDDYINTPFILNPVEGKFSVFVWVKGSAPGQTIISQANGAAWLSLEPSEGYLMTELKGTGRRAAALLSQIIITDGQWHRVSFVWNGFQRILYVDGLEVARDTNVQSDLSGSDGGLHIGAGKNLEAGSFFVGLIDDVRIYNRAVSP